MDNSDQGNDETEEHCKEAVKMRVELDAVVNRIAVLGSDRTVAAFKAIQKPAHEYIALYETDDKRRRYLPRAASEKIDLRLDSEHTELLLAVREEIRTPDDW